MVSVSVFNCFDDSLTTDVFKTCRDVTVSEFTLKKNATGDSITEAVVSADLSLKTFDKYEPLLIRDKNQITQRVVLQVISDAVFRLYILSPNDILSEMRLESRMRKQNCMVIKGLMSDQNEIHFYRVSNIVAAV